MQEVKLEDLLHSATLTRLAQAPAHIRRLGPIIRRSVQTGLLGEFRRYLRRQKIQIKPELTRQLRDYLILKRLDLKDLEPGARARLRVVTLANEDPGLMTADYRVAQAEGKQLHCRDCRWFVSAPHDGSENGNRSCVELGTKGVDSACCGFTARQA